MTHELEDLPDESAEPATPAPYHTDWRDSTYTCPELRERPARQGSDEASRIPSRGMPT